MNSGIFYNKKQGLRLEIWNDNDWDEQTAKDLYKEFNLGKYSEKRYKNANEDEICGFELFKDNEAEPIEHRWSIPAEHLLTVLESVVPNFDGFCDKMGDNLKKDYNWNFKPSWAKWQSMFEEIAELRKQRKRDNQNRDNITVTKIAEQDDRKYFVV